MKFAGPHEVATVSNPGVSNFVHALIAVLAGNAVYSLLLSYFPPTVQHAPFKNPLGLAIDFWFCLVAFGIVKTVAARRRHSGPAKHS